MIVNKIDKATISLVLARAMSTGADFAEIYAEDALSNRISLIDRRIENVDSGRFFGVGLRLYKGLNSVYVYSNNASKDGLLALANDAAAAMGRQKKEGNKGIDFVLSTAHNPHMIKVYPNGVVASKKIPALKSLDSIARAFSDKITQVGANFSDGEKNVLIANSEGLYSIDKRVRTRIGLSAIAESGAEKQMGYESVGQHMGFEMLDELVDLEQLANNAANTAITMLGAPYAPAGNMPVVIENGNGGTIFHEACGHSLEATSVARGLSEMTGKLGQKIASDIVTAYDDGTVPNAYGSQVYDDEGEPTRKNLLIENGVLKNYMIDRLNSRRMGMPLTGNARRESYTYAPTSRMTNTYIANGESSPEELIKNTSYGLYAKKIGGGSVHPATGEFNFAVNEGYIIKNGSIDRPVRGASLIGKGSEVLMKIDMIANNLEHSPGVCGSVSGGVPVTVGQPTIRVSDLLVGGKEDSDD